jgi:arsenite methyltransferase
LKEYLLYTFDDTPAFVSTFDELPLWSASFGLLLLKHLELKRGITVVDMGSGAGFPLLELASRLGESCRVYGVEPWKNANERTKQKIFRYGIKNVEVLECSAENVPLKDGSVDLIVSNLGINNFENPEVVFSECYRLLNKGGRLALTSNVMGHWSELYTVFEESLKDCGSQDLLPILKKDETHRGTAQGISAMFRSSGLKLRKHYEENFEMSFLDGSAFLNHHFIKLGWLSTWLGIFPKERHEKIFEALEEGLNRFSEKSGTLKLTVPMVYLEAVKEV